MKECRCTFQLSVVADAACLVPSTWWFATKQTRGKLSNTGITVVTSRADRGERALRDRRRTVGGSGKQVQMNAPRHMIAQSRERSWPSLQLPRLGCTLFAHNRGNEKDKTLTIQYPNYRRGYPTFSQASRRQNKHRANQARPLLEDPVC